MARQVLSDQAAALAGSVLASLALSYAGRPIPEIQGVLHQALKPCGVRLSADAWRDLAACISARRSVTL